MAEDDTGARDSTSSGVLPDGPDIREELFEADTLAQGVLNAAIFAQMFGEPSPDLLENLGRYELLRQLGAGGMGVVYLARDPELDRHVAIKLLKTSHEDDGAERAERIRAEARAMARLTHPNVVNVYDAGRHGEHLFITMEYVEGTTLGRWIEHEDRPWPEIVRAFVDAGQGLAAAHEVQLIHRDFKPDNVLVSTAEVVKVTDFGIATQAKAPNEATRRSLKVPAGTIRYMSPEALMGRGVDARSDQFSFCVALYEALWEEHPFAAGSVGDLALSLMNEPPRVTPTNSGVPRSVIDAVVRGLARDPDERWPSMNELLDALRDDPTARRRRWLTVGGSAAAVAALAFAMGRSATPPPDPCADGPLQAEALWSPQRQYAVEQRFEGLGLAYAADSARVTDDSLHAWTAEWSDAYAAVCRARHETSEQRHDLRMGCLRQQWQQIDALVALLTEADAELVARVPRAVEELPSPSMCSNTSALAHLEPPGIEFIDEVAVLRGQLAQAKAALSAYHVEDAQRQLGPLHDRASDLGYRPLLAEVALARGIAKIRVSERGADNEWLMDAYVLALETRHEALALTAATWLLLVESQHPSHEVAEFAREKWNAMARALSARLGLPIDQELWRRKTYIDALITQGHNTLAAEEVGETMELLRTTIGVEDPRAAKILDLLAYVQLQSQHPREGLRTLGRVDALHDQWLGEHHPHRINTLRGRIGILLSLGHLQDALAVAQRSLEIHRRAHGAKHPRTLEAYANVAMIWDMLGNHAESRQMFEQAYGEAIPDGSTLDRSKAAAVNNYGFVLYKLGEHEKAKMVCEQALLACERLWPHGFPLTAVVLNNLGLISRALSQPEQGLDFDRRALAIAEGLDPPDPRTISFSLVGIGQGLLALQRDSEAIEPLTRAVELRREGPPPELGEAECLLARVQGRADPSAQELATSGLQRLRQGGPDWSAPANACQAWLDGA